MKTEIKYAPKSLIEVIFPNIGVERRIMGYANGNLENNIILYGTNGTGKTTIANLLPDAIAGAGAMVDYDYDHIMAQKDIKSYLMQNRQINWLQGYKKFFLVLHEFDNAKGKLDKLWTAMDYMSNDMMVIITTNNPMNVHQSIRSRCDLIEMPALKADAVLSRAQQILRIEGLTLSDAQVLSALKQQEYAGNLRKYMGEIDVLLYAASMGLAMPASLPAMAPPMSYPALKVLSKATP